MNFQSPQRETNYFIRTQRSLLCDTLENQHINDINFPGEHLEDFNLLSYESCPELARISAIPIAPVQAGTKIYIIFCR